MKKIIFIITSLLLLTSFYSSDNQTLELNYRLTSVTVYLDNAELFSSANISLQQGKTELIFRNISSNIIPDGIKIAANNNVKILSVKIDKDKNFAQNSVEYQNQLKKIKEFEDQKLVISEKLELLDKQSDYLESNYKMSGLNTANQTQIDDGMKYFNTKMEEIIKQTSKLKNQKNSLIDSLKVYDEIGKKLLLNLEKKSTVLKVKVESQKATASEINLQYLVSNAVWLPLYSIRAKESSNKVNIDYHAQVYNDCGLDWGQVPLTLAIINSTQNVGIPKIEPWTIDGGKKYYKVAKGYFDDKTKDEEETQDNNFLIIDDLNTRFELNEKHDIPSDATPHIIDINSYEKDAEFYTLSIPKIKNGAYKIAAIKDWESMNMVDGNANLYYNDTFQGKTYLNTQQIENNLNVSVGKENSFTINRKNLIGKSHKSLIGLYITEQFNFEIVVKNNKSDNQNIIIKDQIPVSTRKDIEINTLELSGANLESVSGELSWNMNLKPNEVKKLVVSFTVKYPNSERFEINYNENKISSPRFF